jgi:chemotaxis protein MotA
MDFGTIFGVIGGIAAVAISIVGAKGILGSYLDWPSALTTIGGSIAAMLVGHGIKKFLGQGKWIRLVLRIPTWGEERIIARLVAFSEKARREGLLALEDDLEELEDDFLRKGIQLVVDGTDPEIIKNILYTELNQMQTRHEEGANFYNDWATWAPAFGMIGTLAGLIAMLQNINDKSSIGNGMALALITSLYGAIMCYLVFQPTRRKLMDQDGGETRVREIMIEGILSIQSGDNPRILEEKLISFLPPKQRESVRQEAARE